MVRVPSRLLVGNLDFEDHLAPPDPSALGGRVRRSLAALATLMRVFARPDDRIWTPVPCPAARMTSVDGLPRPRIVQGPDAWAAPAESILAWGESAAVGRRRVGETAAAVVPGAPLHERVWRGPFASAAAARRVAHRGFQLDTAAALGCALPGARLVPNREALFRHLAAGGATAAEGEHWVLKAPYSAAGRDRLRGKGRSALAARDEARLVRLHARHGALLFEPWMTRIADFGAVGWIEPGGPRLLGVHGQDVDGYGRFRGLTVSVTALGAAVGLTGPESEALTAAAVRAGQRMAEAGYRGAFGVDAWRYRDAAGRIRFQPLGEINPRITFGLVAHALAGRLHAAGRTFETLRLRFGRGPAGPSETVSAATVVPLILPAGEDPTTVWAEVW